MELTTAAGQSGFRPTRLLTATCEDAWFRCPSCRTDLLRLEAGAILLALRAAVKDREQPDPDEAYRDGEERR